MSFSFLITLSNLSILQGQNSRTQLRSYLVQIGQSLGGAFLKTNPPEFGIWEDIYTTEIELTETFTR